ncbi:coenzyme F420-reducing hydrogenase beta subunit [Dysgonomonadaceae bacterium PH5-43]|nr:coenzyme F420-reducing hydrogenase beta subunit [Dysgonomonadaceae bacterium PH5-43]
MVLFTGTPCQTAALKKYIPYTLSKNLFLCDFVCHGVSSPIIWKEYLYFIEKEYDSKIVATNFRDKDKGWNTHFESFTFENNEKVYTLEFAKLFGRHFIMRPACNNCKYTNFNRHSDFTIGDLWYKGNSNINHDNLGASLLLINTHKGDELWAKIKNNFHYHYIEPDLLAQPNLKEPTKSHPATIYFWEDYKKLDFNRLLKKYTSDSLFYRIKH